MKSQAYKTNNYLSNYESIYAINLIYIYVCTYLSIITYLLM